MHAAVQTVPSKARCGADWGGNVQIGHKKYPIYCQYGTI